MEYKFQRQRTDKISREEIIEELKMVAKHFGFKDYKRRDFDKISKISGNTVIREFGTWEKALGFLKSLLQSQGIELISSNRRSRKRFTEQQLFDEMERIWRGLGHRPSAGEWKLSNPRISDNTYMRYFGGWQNACLEFIEYKMGNQILTDDEISYSRETVTDSVSRKEMKIETGGVRSIGAGLRLKILDRDSFRCVLCGRSPATEIGVKLHIDHKVPFSQGGQSTIDNLQTLCQDCNWGKSDTLLKSR